MSAVALSNRRQQLIAGRYDPLRQTSAVLAGYGRRQALQKSAVSKRHPTPTVVLERQKFRPSDINLMLGRVEQAQNKKSEFVIEPKPAPAPTPKGKGKIGAFAKAAFDTLIPPPPFMMGGRPTYTPNMSIGGKRVEPD